MPDPALGMIAERSMGEDSTFEGFKRKTRIGGHLHRVDDGVLGGPSSQFMGTDEAMKSHKGVPMDGLILRRGRDGRRRLTVLVCQRGLEGR